MSNEPAFYIQNSKEVTESEYREHKKTQAEERKKAIEKRIHKCCEGRGCGSCSYCYGDCDQCNNLDCKGVETGNYCASCYNCHVTGHSQ
jgi:hypothetical protein